MQLYSGILITCEGRETRYHLVHGRQLTGIMSQTYTTTNSSLLAVVHQMWFSGAADAVHQLWCTRCGIVVQLLWCNHCSAPGVIQWFSCCGATTGTTIVVQWCNCCGCNDELTAVWCSAAATVAAAAAAAAVIYYNAGYPVKQR